MFPGVIVILLLAIMFGEKSEVPDRVIMAWLILCSLAGAVWVGGMGAVGLNGLVTKLSGR
jgi:hypothetical protein